MTLLSLRSVRAKMLAWSGLTTVPALLAATAYVRKRTYGSLTIRLNY